MSNVKVRELSGLGQAAFLESAYAVQQQTITWLVWLSGSHTWVLSLAEVTPTDAPGRLLPVTQQLTPQLPH
jgi:hypothetical protein